MRDSLSPVALSRLTWTFEDRRAWEDTYRACLLVAVERDERMREEAVPLAVLRAVTARNVADGGAIYEQRADTRYSVHADNYGKGS